jgi:molybdenum cofactor biosynthesis enzyme MoaA
MAIENPAVTDESQTMQRLNAHALTQGCHAVIIPLPFHSSWANMELCGTWCRDASFRMIATLLLDGAWTVCSERSASVTAIAILVSLVAVWWARQTGACTNDRTPLSVNFHFTRQCNYKCGFCFHTDTSSVVLPLDEQKRGLKLLADAGMRKVNFSGGEPFLVERGWRVGELVRYCKETLHIESVSIVTNGSLVEENWFGRYGKFVDIIAVSCDSFDSATNAKIGRQFKGQNHVDSLRIVSEWCKEYNVLFKLNTVVNAHNKDEDMSEEVRDLAPIRWKVFKVLSITGENAGEGAQRQVKDFEVTDQEFDTFLEKHRRAGLDKVRAPCAERSLDVVHCHTSFRGTATHLSKPLACLDQSNMRVCQGARVLTRT